VNIGKIIGEEKSQPIPDVEGQTFIEGTEPMDPSTIPDSALVDGGTGRISRKAKAKSKFLVQRLETVKRMVGTEWLEEKVYLDVDDAPYSPDTAGAVKIANRIGNAGEKFRIVGATKMIEMVANPQPSVIIVEREP
jgi:hypothetical protein